MAFTAALIGMGLTAAEAATIAGAAGAGAGAAAAGTGAAAGALGTGAAAGAAGLGAGGLGALGAEGAAIPAMASAPAASALPIGPMMGSGAEAIGGGGALGTGSGAAGSTSPFNAFFAPSGGFSQGLDKLGSVGQSMGQDMMPKSTTDYLKLGQMGSQMASPSPMRPAAPPPMMRPGGSAIPLGDPQRLQSLTVGGGGGGGGLDPRTLAMLAKLLGGQR